MKKIYLIPYLIFIVGFMSCGSSNESAPINNPPSALEPSAKSDDFSGTGSLIGYITNNETSLPSVSRAAGRYYADLVNNANNITLHFNNEQGRLDAKLLAFPFEFIARNIGIGVQNNSQIAHASSGSSYIFAGIQVHVTDLNSRNSSHIVVGHRGGTAFTLEGKNTVNGVSSVDDLGANIVPSGRADIRIVGNADRTITVYWQQSEQTTDNWLLYDGSNSSNGRMPGLAPVFGDAVYVGLITYAQGGSDIPFVGTCDAIEIFE